MSDLTLLHLTTPQALRHQADLWDDLWLRSAVTHPTARASMICNWLAHFRDDARFQAVVVRDATRFMAVLPLVARRQRGLLPCRDVPGNEWASAGQLLLDPDGDVERACELMVRSLAELNCSAFWFASIPVQAPWWQALIEAAHRAAWSTNVRTRYQVGYLPLQETWARQKASLSKGFRKQIDRSIRQLERAGPIRLRFVSPRSGPEASRWLEAGLQLEHAGWKGAAKTSILANRAAHDFVREQARQLAEQRQLTLAWLEQNGDDIAFEYGWSAKGVYHSYKVAYDQQFQQFSPGQLLLYFMLRHFHDTRTVHAVDFLGPLDDAVRRWRTQVYPMGRLLLAPPRSIGQAIVLASRCLPTPPLCASGEACSTWTMEDH